MRSPQPVTIATGVPGRACLTIRATSQPEIPGIPRSVMTRSNASFSTQAMPDSPSVQYTTWWPSRVRASLSTSPTSRSSSMTRIRPLRLDLPTGRATGSTTVSPGGGNLMMNVVPWPSWLWTSSSALWRVTMP